MAELSSLIETPERGEEVIKSGAQAVRIPGTMRGQIRISDDYDDLPSDISAAFGMK